MALLFVMLGKLALRSSVFSAELRPGHPRKVNLPVCIPFPDVVCFWRLKKDRLPWPQAKTLSQPRVAALKSVVLRQTPPPRRKPHPLKGKPLPCPLTPQEPPSSRSLQLR